MDGENNAALLRAMEEVPDEARGARFRCVLCLVDPWAGGQDELALFTGECAGKIARSPRGQGGFGYDPLFLVDELGRTMAELTEDEKQKVSHRGRAVSALRPHLEEMLEQRAQATERISYVGNP